MSDAPEEVFRRKFIGFLCIILVVIVVFAVIGRRNDISDKYEAICIDSNCVKITDYANVRSDPIVQDGDVFNTFGLIEESNFTMEIPQIFETDVTLDQNGEFLGLSVDDILATPEGRNWFPSRIKDDPDGIVWINSKYIVVIA